MIVAFGAWGRPMRLWLAGALLGAGVMAGAIAAQAQVAADTPVNPFRNAPEAVEAGRKTFDATCSACHGPAASGGRGPALNTGRFTHGDQDYDIFRTIQGGVAAGGMPAFPLLPANDVWRLVSYLKSLSGQGSTPGGSQPAVFGDEAAAARGQAVFFGDGGCAGCHEINGRGLPLASDLSAVGAKGPDAIRAGILHPTGRGPRVVEVVQPGGAKARGAIVAEDSFNLILRGFDGAVLRLDRRGLRSVATVPGGLTPAVRLSASDTEAVAAYLSRQTTRAVAGAIPPSRSTGLSASRIVNAAAEPQNWLTYWGDYKGHHFSALGQITRSNVGALQARWAAQLPGPSPLQAAPVVVDGIMYVSGPPGDVYALDAQTGLQIWKFSRKQDVVNPYQINPANRGVAVLDGRVFVGTLDNLLIAVDARTGRELWERRIANTLEGYTITGAPLALKDRIVVGVGCGEYGVRGFLESYDPATGRRLWRVETIPGPGEPGNDTWAGDSWKRGGGGTWLTGTYDAELDTLYWAVGNPAPSYDWKIRAGDNLHTNSVLALEPKTGRLKWSYQFTPSDSHDWDSVQDMVLADRMVDGRMRKLLLHGDRNGFFYVLDRTDGAFLAARPFVHQTWNDGFDPKGRPMVRPDSVATVEGRPVFPTTSATNFQAPSYDAATGVFYLIYQDAEGFAAYAEQPFEPGKLYTAPPRKPRPPATVEPRVGLRAFDAVSGRVLWDFPLSRFSAQPGLLATAGGLVFAATAEGSFIALDNATGDPLWRFRTGGPMSASPISYAVAGRQYVAIAAGNVVYSFALQPAGARP